MHYTTRWKEVAVSCRSHVSFMGKTSTHYTTRCVCVIVFSVLFVFGLICHACGSLLYFLQVSFVICGKNLYTQHFEKVSPFCVCDNKSPASCGNAPDILRVRTWWKKPYILAAYVCLMCRLRLSYVLVSFVVCVGLFCRINMYVSCVFYVCHMCWSLLSFVLVSFVVYVGLFGHTCRSLLSYMQVFFVIRAYIYFFGLTGKVCQIKWMCVGLFCRIGRSVLSYM